MGGGKRWTGFQGWKVYEVSGGRWSMADRHKVKRMGRNRRQGRESRDLDAWFGCPDSVNVS